ncbi:MAG: ATP-binding cassette domain-containing protein [Pseudomonadota bacterium]
MPPAPPLIALQDAGLRFGPQPLFESLDLGLGSDERACLVGRNGCGKSTLLRTLAGQQPLDSGQRIVKPGARVIYLPQEPAFSLDESVFDFVAQGLPNMSLEQRESSDHRVDAVLERVKLQGTRQTTSLSGGEGRRAAIARAMVGEADVLLLDEPTNHLDLTTIEWLEDLLARFRGALMIISHDRTFLEKTTNRVLWLDRGHLRRLDQGFAKFESWVENLNSEEAQNLHKLEREIKREEKWLHRGVTARRARNEGRLKRLQRLRSQRREWVQSPGKAKLAAANAEGGGNLVIEAKNLEKSYAGQSDDPSEGKQTSKAIIRGFSTRIRRGDRIGIIGPNGAGKTTLVRLLIGDLAPDRGSLRLGTQLTPLYFDQRRASLEPDDSLWQNLVPGGGDSLMVQGRQRHVVSYLKDFLFDEGQARQPVRSLSGGERNRLLLARLFAQPSNLLILDEPTNDLDLETLDLLEDVLALYEGTLLLVSHDRDFLDRLVNGIIAVEGDGEIQEYAGGYRDYLVQRRQSQSPSAPKDKTAPKKSGPPKAKSAAKKLSYNQQRELDQLPAKIDALENHITALNERLADPTFFEADPKAFETKAQALTTAQAELAHLEERWLELESLKDELAQERVDTAAGGKV